MLLALGWWLADWMKKHIPEKRVGLILPPGIGGTVANLACVLAGKIPVNLNFTAGKTANEYAIDLAELKTIVTAGAMVQKIEHFPWTSNRVFLETVFGTLKKHEVLWRWAQVLCLPEKGVIERIGLSPEGGDREAGLLFTSGSSGDPKGVILSHGNLVGNVNQISEVFQDRRIRSVLGCLPLFHSFGFTATLWWPLISGPPVVTYPSALDVNRIVEIVEKYRISLFITTPTFLRNYIRKATPEQFRSLRLVATGAEKLPISILKRFEKRFGIPVCEGYGMTEASPVVSVNYPDPEDASIQAHRDGPYRRVGSVGRPLPGIEVKVKDMERGVDIPSDQSGILCFKGPNIFRGYLKDAEKTAEVLEDEWYLSGDVGHVDRDGFLYIEGRLSRFSKIAGEMVPHGTVEHKLSEIFAEMAGEETPVTVMGVQDPVKGEALVALTTGKFERAEIQTRFASLGLPNLWMPKIIQKVETIPHLASGKPDLRQCQDLANKMAGTGVPST